MAAAIGRGRELESGPELHQLIVRLLEIRTSVLQLDVLAYDVDGLTLVASNEPRNCGSGLLGWPASESGRLRYGEWTHGSSARRRRALTLAILLHPDGIHKSFPGKKGTSCNASKG